MRKELVIKTRSLAGSSDLTLFAPLKRGLVPSLEAVTYKTRVKRLLKALSVGRSSNHEHSFIHPFSDAIERVGRINSVRVAVLEPEDKVLLAVTFDGAWESYIRVLWQKVGALLDVIFCNTQDYVTAYDHSFEEWVAWANRVQIETNFFYGMPFTVDDVRYMRDQESLHRGRPSDAATDRAALEQVLRRQESIAWDVTRKGHFKIYPETTKLGLQSLAGLYRLADLYVPGSEDGKYLHRAARELLLEFVHLIEDTSILEIPLELVHERFEKQLEWLKKDPADSLPHGFAPPQLPSAMPSYDAADVQGGILESYERVTHGCLVLVAFRDSAAVAQFLQTFLPKVTRSNTPIQPGDLICSIAFTCEGLRAAGLSEAQLAFFPEEFREGMEARAGLLGDFRLNHPRRWRLPVRNWPASSSARPERIELSAVHAIVQLRKADEPALQFQEASEPQHPLSAEIERLFPAGGPARVLSVQSMRRYIDQASGHPTEHFGFVDGLAQPVIDPAKAGKVHYRNQVHLGEVLLGYDNEADQAPKDAPSCPWKSERNAWLCNGSFLVVRKLKQDVEALEKAVGAAVRPGLARLDILAKMMGRRQNGTPLIPETVGDNDFDYSQDSKGLACPFHAHIRRANPRSDAPKEPPEDVPEQPGQRTPRLMRRGMSYGPQYIRDSSDPRAAEINPKERGIIFMAYNASITEQYEVVQRWINGGNSTGTSSSQSDAFMGVAESGQRRYFRFQHNGEVIRVAMDGWDALLQEPKPIVRLEWGAYLFTPSLKVLGKIRDVAAKAGVGEPPWSASAGLLRIEELEALERQAGPAAAALAWKAALEDPEAQEKFQSASIWAAIREHRGGVLRTPYGVIVADHKFVMDVLENTAGNFSVAGYLERMRKSLGPIYLGLDDTGPQGDYARESAAPNAAASAITLPQAFERARKATKDALQEFIRQAKEEGQAGGYPWELTLDAKELVDQVLATICEHWFGLTQKNGRLKRGGARWDWKPPSAPFYPGHFTAPSRYIFQPHPGATVEDFGQRYGKALTDAVRGWIQDHRDANTAPATPDGSPAPLGVAILGPNSNPTPLDLAARTLVGVLMGFLPPADGNLRLILNEWLKDGTFWSLRASLAGREFTDATDATNLLLEPLMQAMQLRPSPELVWRVATRAHEIGRTPGTTVRVEEGDTIVVSLVSATQQRLAAGQMDIDPVFGGDRSASGHPTHACPAYPAAKGVLLGVMAALLEVKESMRPGPAPLSFVVQDASLDEELRLRERDAHFELLRERTRETPRTRALRKVAERIVAAPMVGRGTSTGELLLWGDSWFHYSSLDPDAPVPSNVRVFLENQGFGFRTEPMGASGMKVEEMASSRKLNDFKDTLHELLAGNHAPKAILLSGGGNDTVYTPLKTMLNPAPSTQPLIDDEVQKFVYTKLLGFYETILTGINAVCAEHNVRPLPVLVHAYDHPIPDGRFISWQRPGDLWSWLYRPIAYQRGYTVPQGTGIMRDLIDHLHAMLGRLSQRFPNVIRVPTVGTLDRFASEYRLYWENELHPTPAGFSLIAKQFGDILDRL